MRFTIPEEYLCDVLIYKEWGMFDHIPVDELTPDQLVKIIKGEDRCSSQSNKDHDEFTKLRNQLEELGHIRCERNWWNGDRVLEPFYVNEWKFEQNHKFPCASAMRVSIECARKFGWKSISNL